MVSVFSGWRISALRGIYGTAAFIVAIVAVMPVFGATASAGTVTVRTMALSSSAPSASNVKYAVSFSTPAAATVGGVVIDFCSNTPIPGDPCTAPTGLDTNNDSTLIYAQSGISSFAVDTVDAQVNRIILTDSTPASVSGAVSFELGNATSNGILNPSVVSTSADQGTFYGRIYTYSSAAAAQGHTSNAPSGYIDAGSVALSTANQISLQAKVMVLLELCVFTGANCAAGGTAIDLGDDFGLLRTSGTYVDTKTTYDMLTNAESGAVLHYKAPLPTAGSFTLPSIGTNATVPVAGTSQFGLCSYQSGGQPLSVAAPYNHSNCSAATQTAGTNTPGGVNGAQFAFDTAAAASADGDLLATIGAGVFTQGKVNFVANVSESQPSGTYTNTFTFIATGTF